VSRLSQTIEHTLLGATTTPAMVARLCAEAIEYGFLAVCVPPIQVARAKSELRLSQVRVVSVVGFPLGGSLPGAVADEAERVLTLGADEIDMVIPLGLALGGELEAVTLAVAAVRSAARGKILKAIVETGLFGPSELEAVARATLAGAPDFLKTSTGFGPRGASVEDVERLVRWSSGQAQVKASGGIRTAQQARALLAAGATRLGTSSGVAIVSDTSEAVDP
jgi:deoxyribose-phosphate aldolase